MNVNYLLTYLLTLVLSTIDSSYPYRSWGR